MHATIFDGESSRRLVILRANSRVEFFVAYSFLCKQCSTRSAASSSATARTQCAHDVHLRIGLVAYHMDQCTRRDLYDGKRYVERCSELIKMTWLKDDIRVTLDGNFTPKRLRAVPEIMLRGGRIFCRPLHPKDKHGVRAPRPPGHVSALINPHHYAYGSNKYALTPRTSYPHPTPPPLGHVNKTPSPPPTGQKSACGPPP